MAKVKTNSSLSNTEPDNAPPIYPNFISIVHAPMRTNKFGGAIGRRRRPSHEHKHTEFDMGTFDFGLIISGPVGCSGPGALNWGISLADWPVTNARPLDDVVNSVYGRLCISFTNRPVNDAYVYYRSIWYFMKCG